MITCIFANHGYKELLCPTCGSAVAIRQKAADIPKSNFLGGYRQLRSSPSGLPAAHGTCGEAYFQGQFPIGLHRMHLCSGGNPL